MNQLSLLALLGFSFSLYRRKQVPVSVAPLVVVSGLSISLYFSALMNLLGPAETLLQVAGVVALLDCVRVHLEKSTDLLESRNAAIAMLTSASLLVALLPRDFRFVYWDEYATWGPSLRTIWSVNSLWGSNAPFEHKEYLPGQPLIQSFFMNDVYLDERAVLSIQLMLILISLIGVVGLLARSSEGALVGFAICLPLPFVFGFVYRTIYVDLLLSVVFAAGLACALRARSDNRYLPIFWLINGLCSYG